MLKAGFIGFGRMGITHFSILNPHPSVEIVAVCDQSSAMLNILKKYIDVKTYSDYRKMIDEEALDFVVISTPADSHADILKTAIAKGLHIFVEKPFTLNKAQGNEILELSQATKLVNQVGYVCRFHDVFMEIKKLLDNNILGEVKRFKSEMFGATITKDSKTSWRGKKSLGGGCMFEYASHCIDLAIYLFGEPDKVTGSVLQRFYSSDVEDIVSSTFLYDNGMNGTVLANWSDQSYRKPTNRIEILGKKGKIIADQYSYKMFLKEDDPSKKFYKGWTTCYITDIAENVRFDVRGRVFTRQLDYFIDSIEQSRLDNLSSFTEALKTDIIMDEIRSDADRSLLVGNKEPLSTPVLTEDFRQPSIWKKLTNLIGR